MKRFLTVWIAGCVISASPTLAQDPFLYLTEETLHFYDVEAGQHRDRSFLVINQGAGVLIGSVMPNPGMTMYMIQEGSGSYSLASGDSLKVTIRLAPEITGTFDQRVDVVHNAKNLPSPAGVDLAGNGIADDLHDDYEPNDSAAKAFDGQGDVRTSYASINPEDDVDYYRIKAPVDALITVEAGNTPGSNLDGRIWLYDDQGNLLVENDDLDSDTGASALSHASADSGTYFVRYAHYTNTTAFPAEALRKASLTETTGAYHLVATVRQNPFAKLDAEAHHFGAVRVGEAAEWELRVRNTGGGKLKLSAGFDGGSSAFVIDSPAGDVTLQPLEQTTYRIQFTPKAKGFITDRFVLEYPVHGATALNYVQLTGQATPAINDRYEPNNTADSAYTIAYGFASTGAAIAPIGDVDYFEFSGRQGDSISVSARRTTGSDLDGAITVYDEIGNELAYNDDEGGTDSSRVSLLLPSDGPYYIRYAFYQNDRAFPERATSKRAVAGETGTYTLWLANHGGPVLGLSEDRLDFGEAGVGGYVDKTLFVTNLGGDTLRGSVDVTVGQVYYIVSSASSSFRIASGDTALFSIQFSPSGPGSFSGELAVEHDGTEVPTPVRVDLSGTGAVWTPAELSYATTYQPFVGRITGETELYAGASPHLQYLAFLTGPARTWDFTEIDWRQDSTYLHVYSSFNDSTAAGDHASYQNATFVQRAALSDGSPGIESTYYRSEPSGLYQIGGTRLEDGDGDGSIDTLFGYSDPPTLDLPYSNILWSRWRDSTQFVLEAKGIRRVIHTTIDTTVISGWGKLATAEGTWDCIRIDHFIRVDAPPLPTGFRHFVEFVTPTDNSTQPGRHKLHVFIRDDGLAEEVRLYYEQAAKAAPTLESAISLSENAVNFGEAPLGGFVDRTLWIRNTGEGDLVGRIAMTSGMSAFSVTSSDTLFALLSQDSMAVGLRFEPFSESSIVGEMQIHHNAPNEVSPLTIRLDGSGAYWSPLTLAYRNTVEPLLGTTVERVVRYAPDTTGLQYLASLSGPAQTWDFTNVSFDDGDSTFIEYRAFDDRTQVGSDPRFASTTYVTVESDADSTIVPDWRYYRVDSTGSFWVGSSGEEDLGLDGTLDLYTSYLEPSPPHIPYGAGLGRTWMDSVNITSEVNGQIDWQGVSLDTVIVTGWGRLITTEGTRDCIRVEFRGLTKFPIVWLPHHDIRFYTVTDPAEDAVVLWAEISLDQLGSVMGARTTTEKAMPATQVDLELELPSETGLRALYPNPLSDVLKIEFQVAETSRGEVDVFDALGRLVVHLWRGNVDQGVFRTVWRPGRAVSEGLYFVRLRTGRSVDTHPVVLAR